MTDKDGKALRSYDNKLQYKFSNRIYIRLKDSFFIFEQSSPYNSFQTAIVSEVNLETRMLSFMNYHNYGKSFQWKGLKTRDGILDSLQRKRENYREKY